MNTSEKIKKLRRAKKRNKQLQFLVLIAGIIILICFLFLALIVKNFSLNKEVRILQTELNDLNSEIDSKNGQIMSNADLKAIESEARALGMTEATPEQYVYESAAKKQTVIFDSPVGLYDFLRFFQQVRNENLWPQGQ